VSELYQSVILDHNRTPRNFRELPDATNHAEGRNPLCGDHFDIWLDDLALGTSAIPCGPK